MLWMCYHFIIKLICDYLRFKGPISVLFGLLNNCSKSFVREKSVRIFARIILKNTLNQ